jgi:hypothetical protein
MTGFDCTFQCDEPAKMAATSLATTMVCTETEYPWAPGPEGDIVSSDRPARYWGTGSHRSTDAGRLIGRIVGVLCPLAIIFQAETAIASPIAESVIHLMSSAEHVVEFEIPVKPRRVLALLKSNGVSDCKCLLHQTAQDFARLSWRDDQFFGHFFPNHVLSWLRKSGRRDHLIADLLEKRWGPSVIVKK